MQYMNISFALSFLLIPLFIPLVVSSDEIFPDNNGVFFAEKNVTKVESSTPDASTSDPNNISKYLIISGFIGNVDSCERPYRETLRGFRRINPKNILKHETRNKIFTIICQNPGINLSKLAELSECNESTLRYHIDQISQENFIVRYDNGRSSHFFEKRIGFSSEEQQFLSCISSEKSNRLLQLIHDNPGISRNELAKKLGIASSTVTRSVQHLSSEGLIILEKNGRFTRHYISKDFDSNR